MEARPGHGPGDGLSRFLRVVLAAFSALALLGRTGAAHAQAPIKIVVLGDSLSAGFGLPVDAAFRSLSGAR